MTQAITKLGTQPETKFQSKRSNLAVRAVMDVYTVTQKTAQSELYYAPRVVAYSALRLAGVA